MYEYPRYITPNFDRFSLREILEATEKMVCTDKGEKKYSKFAVAREHGGSATAFTVGCVYRCFFCSFGWDRDFPEKYGQFHSPLQAFNYLKEVAINAGAEILRISGGDAAIGKRHVLPLLEMVENSEFSKIIIETTGAPFGLDRDYAEKAARFKKSHFRMMLRAGVPDNFARRTGVKEEDMEIVFDAMKNLLDFGATFHVSAMTDKRIMKWKEREELIKRLSAIDARLVNTLEEETIAITETSTARFRYAGLENKLLDASAQFV